MAKRIRIGIVRIRIGNMGRNWVARNLWGKGSRIESHMVRESREIDGEERRWEE